MLEIDSPAPPESEPDLDLGVDPLLWRAVIRGTKSGLQMAQTRICPVGASRLVSARHSVTVMVGLVGAHSGNIAMNLAEPAAWRLASGLLGHPIQELDEDCVDAIMELGNMVAGGIKAVLSNTDYAVSNISLPSVIFGQRYTVGYSRGIRTVCAEFELSDMPFSSMEARYMSSTLSLLRSPGV